MAFKLPESLDGLNVDEIDALTDEARNELKDINLSDDASDDDIAAAEAIVDAIASLDEARDKAAEKAAERQGRLDKIEAAKVTPEPEAKDDTPEEDEPKGEVITPDEVDGKPVAPAEDTAPAPEPVLADGRSPMQRAAQNALPVDFVAPKVAVALTAAADVPGFSTGAALDGLEGVTAAINARAKALPKHNMATDKGGVRMRFGAAVVTREFDDEQLIQTKGGETDDFNLVHRAGDTSRLGPQGLTAAGWCAPSETFYDLCEFEDVTGMLDVPEFQVRRGGIRFTQGPRFDSIYNNLDASGSAKSKEDNANFLVTESQTGFNVTTSVAGTPGQAVALTEKPCAIVECDDFEEVRLACLGICVKSPILMEMSYPELTRRFLEGVLAAHQHRLNEYKIMQIASAAVDAGVMADQTPARTVFNLDGVWMKAMAIRYKWRLSSTATIEMVGPNWLKEVIKLDIARENDRDSRCVSDAEVNELFACHNVRVQWVYDWQDLVVDGANYQITFPNPGGTAGQTPTDVDVLMYPAGSWTAGMGDTFQIDTVYDAASLADNVYTALFVEECLLMVNRCYEGIKVNIPLCTTGQGVVDAAVAACMDATFAPIPGP